MFWNNSAASLIQRASSVSEKTDYAIADLQEALEDVQINLDTFQSTKQMVRVKLPMITHSHYQMFQEHFGSRLKENVF